MLEYFGFYATPDSPPDASTSELGATARDPWVARAARLVERGHHTPSPAPAGRSWEPAARER